MVFTSCYTVFVIATSLYRLWVSSRIPGVEKQKGHIRVPWTYRALFAGYSLVVVASVVEYFLLRAPRPDSLHWEVTSLGLIIYFFGIIAREWPLRVLDKFWSHQVEIREEHRLIMEGPYRYLRHPNYLCLLAEVVGFPLVSNSYLACVLAIVLYVPLLLLRIRYEEEALIEKFGNAYREYRQEVPALIPVPGRTAARLKERKLVEGSASQDEPEAGA